MFDLDIVIQFLIWLSIPVLGFVLIIHFNVLRDMYRMKKRRLLKKEDDCDGKK
jgi:hypothetical protein